MNKTALITGASSGIGRELAKIHASKGDDLVLVARTISKLEELKTFLEEKYQVKVLPIEHDLALVDSAREVYDEIKNHNIQIDFLINNAGLGDHGKFYETDWSKDLNMLNLNIITLTQFCKLFIPEMLAQGNGKIMNVASTAAFQPGPIMAIYYATKAYVLHFSEAINNELKDRNVTVTALCPGPTKSGFQSQADIEDIKLVQNSKLVSSREVAKYGYRSMMKDKAVAIHGFLNKIMAMMVRFIPRNLVVKMVRSIHEEVD